jgi:hypothetical protein
VGSGATSSASFGKYDPASSSWKTWPPSAAEASTAFSGTWPRSGMTRNGIAYQREALAPLTGGTASSSWPTPTANAGTGPSRSGRQGGANLQTAVQERFPTPRASDGAKGSPNQVIGGKPTLSNIAAHYPTPTARDWRVGACSARTLKRHSLSLPDATACRAGSGQLSPMWTESLMGFPIGWTDSAASATPSSRKSPSSSAGGSA